MKILIVEDEQFARESLREQLRGYDVGEDVEVMTASNGAEGFSLFTSCDPDIVFTDIRMPVMDGISMIREIRKGNPTVPIIVLSAYSDFGYARDAMVLGTQDYLLKPVELSSLYGCLDKYLGQERKQFKENGIEEEDAVHRFISAALEGEKQEFIGKNLFRKAFPSYVMVSLFFTGTRPSRSEVYRLTEKCAEIQENAEKEDSLNARAVPVISGVWCLVFRSTANSRSFVRRLSGMFEESGYDAWFGVSRERSSEQEIPAAWSEAYEALESRILDGVRIHFAENRNTADNEKIFSISPEIEKQIFSSLERHDAVKCRNLLRILFENIPADVDVRTLESLCTDLDVMFRRVLSSGEGDDIFFRKIRQHGILPFASLKEMEEHFERASQTVCSQLSVQDSPDTVEIIENYVRQNFSESVTIKDIAENVLFMNKDYVSHLFMEKKGISFSQYLRQVRIEHAKEYLGETELSAADIAGLTGYQDVSLFIRNFKTEAGLTPGKYRTMQRRENENS